VDRVEQVSADQVRFAAGRFRLAIDGRILPLAAQGEIEGRQKLSVLRLKDDITEVSYAIDEALDIIILPHDIAPAREPGPVAGVMLIDDEQVELLDVLWVFDEHADREIEEDSPLCLISGDQDGWMASFIRPLLESAGYRVTAQLAAGQIPAVVLSSEEASAPTNASAPIVRLRRRRSAKVGDDSVYRYDRAGLLSALEARMAGKAGR
jgi:two-component system chemotaxis sensor kinase CheA